MRRRFPLQLWLFDIHRYTDSIRNETFGANEFYTQGFSNTVKRLSIIIITRSSTYSSCVVLHCAQTSSVVCLSSLLLIQLERNRSCIVGPNLEVRVCTLGTVINRSAYPSDYCQLEGTGRQSQPMPIRWMSWESILLVSTDDDNERTPQIFQCCRPLNCLQGKFSSKSDVWSFAITLWEILTYAREQPYENLSDEKVIENCGHIYQDDKKHVSTAH